MKLDSSRIRPTNMFDITDMTYEAYVERHYEIMLQKHRENLAIQMAMAYQQPHLQQQQLRQQQQPQSGGGYAGYRGGRR